MSFHCRKSNKRIGDIMKRFAPFLKLYTDYVKNFDSALTHVENWNEKSPEFRTLLAKLQSKVLTVLLVSSKYVFLTLYQ